MEKERENFKPKNSDNKAKFVTVTYILKILKHFSFRCLSFSLNSLLVMPTHYCTLSNISRCHSFPWIAGNAYFCTLSNFLRYYVMLFSFFPFSKKKKKISFFPLKFIQHLEETKRKDEEEIILYWILYYCWWLIRLNQNSFILLNIILFLFGL